MLYPCSILVGRGARAEHLSIVFASEGQHIDTGGKVFHLAPDTASVMVNKSISKGGGCSVYRGLIRIKKGAVNAKAHVRCDSLILDEKSKSNTYPHLEIDENKVAVGHEATVGRIEEDQLFYLMSRGLKEEEALAMIVRGFIEPIVKELPLEYAVELNKLIEVEMRGAVG
jgi:Fe-S cluster assembly protein SufB